MDLHIPDAALWFRLSFLNAGFGVLLAALMGPPSTGPTLAALQLNVAIGSGFGILLFVLNDGPVGCLV